MIPLGHVCSLLRPAGTAPSGLVIRHRFLWQPA
jgi:hypothetical protein